MLWCSPDGHPLMQHEPDRVSEARGVHPPLSFSWIFALTGLASSLAKARSPFGSQAVNRITRREPGRTSFAGLFNLSLTPRSNNVWMQSGCPLLDAWSRVVHTWVAMVLVNRIDHIFLINFYEFIRLSKIASICRWTLDPKWCLIYPCGNYVKTTNLPLRGRLRLWCTCTTTHTHNYPDIRAKSI